MASVVQHPEPHSFSRTPPFDSRGYDNNIGPAPPPSFAPHGSHSRLGQDTPFHVSRVQTPPRGAPPKAYLPNLESPIDSGHIPYSSRGHTLGPTFSEEEDGDDTEWIASQLQSLGLNHRQKAPPRQLGTRAGDLGPPLVPDLSDILLQHQLEMQNLAILRAQNEDHQRRVARGIRAAEHTGQSSSDLYVALYTLQDRHAMVEGAILGLGERIMQLKSQLGYAARQHQQAPPPLQAPYGYMQPPRPLVDQRAALSAQMQANIQARTARAQQEETDAEIRARFERAPNMVAPPSVSVQSFESRRSPPSDNPWISSAPTTTVPSPSESTGSSSLGNRFATSQGANLSALLSRRQANESESTADGYFAARASSGQASPVSPSVQQERANTQSAAVGHGRPQNLAPPSRTWSAPSQPVTQLQLAPAPRAVSYNEAIHLRACPIRQPLGPPGEPHELGDRNFAALLRKQAGANLGMLNRRADTTSTSPKCP